MELHRINCGIKSGNNNEIIENTQKQDCKNRVIVLYLCKIRGIGAAGSAFASHVKGRGFESHMLHSKGLVFTRPFSFRVAFRVASFFKTGSIDGWRTFSVRIYYFRLALLSLLAYNKLNCI